MAAMLTARMVARRLADFCCFAGGRFDADRTTPCLCGQRLTDKSSDCLCRLVGRQRDPCSGQTRSHGRLHDAHGRELVDRLADDGTDDTGTEREGRVLVDFDGSSLCSFQAGSGEGCRDDDGSLRGAAVHGGTGGIGRYGRCDGNQLLQLVRCEQVCQDISCCG